MPKSGTALLTAVSGTTNKSTKQNEKHFINLVKSTLITMEHRNLNSVLALRYYLANTKHGRVAKQSPIILLSVSFPSARVNVFYTIQRIRDFTIMFYTCINLIFRLLLVLGPPLPLSHSHIMHKLQLAALAWYNGISKVN